RDAIEFVGEGRLDGLPDRYAAASVTVMPSIGEVFGLALVESLACATPVVGNALEGPGVIISSSDIGFTVPLRGDADLVDPERAHDLAEAVIRAIEVAQNPVTVDRCREHASQWSRERVGRRLECLYEEMAAGRAPASVSP